MLNSFNRERLRRFLLAAQLNNDSIISRFSWSRVRLCLLKINLCQHTISEDRIGISFLFHEHVILLYKNGRAVLSNPWNDKSSKINMLAPKDIQTLVSEIINTFRPSVSLADLKSFN